MSDREALAAALDNFLVIENEQTFNAVLVMRDAARERRDQLPEKCGTCGGVANAIIENRPLASCPTCHGSGKVYPAELVERTAWTICDAEYQEPMWRFLTPEGQRRYMRLAVAVLDALNGETR